MKRFLLVILTMGLVFNGFAQRPTVPKDLLNAKAKIVRIPHKANNYTHDILPSDAIVKAIPGEDDIGTTWYDLQTNATMQSRIFAYDDGTIGAAFTFSSDESFDDRGTGYNYFDGSEWGDAPEERIETIKTGWPSYNPYGENGEVVISHDFNNGKLLILKRDQKGIGAWSEDGFLGPDGQKISWNSTITAGINHTVMHILCITWPIGNNGTLYEGLNGALLYSRSSDGGLTWDYENTILEGLTSDDYTGFSADNYDWASFGENTIAFLVGESWVDLILMKSADGGDTWTKTVIWDHPYPDFEVNNPYVTSGFYCPDGSHHLAFDQSGKVHVVFGINWAQYSLTPSAGFYWRPGTGGIGYWNEDRPTFSADTMALCPYPGTETCTYSELVEDYSLIGWMQDVNENDTIDWTDNDPALFYVGTSSYPQILIDDMNHIYVVFSSITEGYTNGTPLQTCRHLWCRTSPNGEWWGKFTDLTEDFVHWVHDCVYPSISPVSDDPSQFYLVYQYDGQPGTSVQGDPPTPAGENTIAVMTVYKPEVWSGVEEQKVPIYETDVSQNYPNPFTGSSTVKVNVRYSTPLSLEVVNIMGQVVYTLDAGKTKPGMNTLIINASNLTSGLYFYTVKAGETSITKKMIVE